ncbi:MAG: hypothetical protein F6K58_08700 [Symploca sp. SIO2E9]|nr:hypothetical protein [Symploca sp. SIO2E9]
MRSPHTRHAYAKDLKDFFGTIANSELTPEMVTYFLQLERTDAVTKKKFLNLSNPGEGLPIGSPSPPR